MRARLRRYRRVLWVGLVAVLSLAASAALYGETARPPAGSRPAHPPLRLVSLAPSITETLYALGLGDRVIAVTRYCEFPPEVMTKSRLGTMSELSVEALLALQPDLVLLLEGHEDTVQRLGKLGIRALTVRHATLEQVLQSFPAIGRVCGVPGAGEQLAATLRAQLGRVHLAVGQRPLARVLVSTLREQGSNGLSGVRIAGRDGLYNELIRLAGGRNVYEGPLAYPAVSVESLRLLAPDVVVELVPTGFSVQDALNAWRSETAIPAVRAERVHALGTLAVVPGPRLGQTVEQLARLLHPGVLP